MTMQLQKSKVKLKILFLLLGIFINSIRESMQSLVLFRLPPFVFLMNFQRNGKGPGFLILWKMGMM